MVHLHARSIWHWWCVQAWSNGSPILAAPTRACMPLQVQNSTLYVKVTATNKWAWYPASCAAAYDYICELHTSLWACPPSPPPAAPVIDTEDVDLCRFQLSSCWVVCQIDLAFQSDQLLHRGSSMAETALPFLPQTAQVCQPRAT